MSIGLNIRVFSKLKGKTSLGFELSLFKGLVEHVTGGQTFAMASSANITVSRDYFLKGLPKTRVS